MDTEGADTPGFVASDGACAFAIRELKRVMGRGLTTLLKDVRDMVASQKKIIMEMKNVVSTAERLEEFSADLILCRDCKRRRNSVELPLDKFDEAMQGASAVLPWVKLTCIVTTTSFALQVPNDCAMHLINPNVLEMFSNSELNVLKCASGFAMLLTPPRRT